MLKGNLSGFSLGEIFQSLAVNHHTGTLTIRSAGSEGTKYIYFAKGQIRFFSHGLPRTPPLGEVLVRQGVLDASTLETALARSQQSGTFLGQFLCDQGLISSRDIVRALQTKICEEIYDLFCWSEGEFEFEIGECPDEVFDALQKSVQVTINTNSVIMEGLRRLDEWGLIRGVIRTGNEIFVPTGAPPPRERDVPVDRLLRLVDGRRSVTDIHRESGGTRFETFKGLHDLVVAGTVRALSVEELTAAADAALESQEYPLAALYLRCATELRPEAGDLLCRLGDVLAKFYQDTEAEAAYRSALRVYSEQGDRESVAALAEKLPPNAGLGEEDLRVLLSTYTELKQVKKALWAGNQLARVLEEKGRLDEAAHVLDSLVQIDPEDLNLRLQIASFFQQSGDAGRAIAWYEEVSRELERQKKFRDAIKILKLIADLEPARGEIRQQIATLVARQEKIEQQRKRRVTIAGVSTIALIVISVIPIIYEIKARELFQHAARMQEIGESTADFTPAKEAYEELLESYSLCTKVPEARARLDYIASMERTITETLKQKDRERNHEMARQRKAVALAIRHALRKAHTAEDAGRLLEAHAHYRQALALAKKVNTDLEIRLPMLVTSDPPGADLRVDDQPIGRTPLTLRYQPGHRAKFRLTITGCETVEKEEDLSTQHRLDFTLPRKPIAEYVLPSTFEQSVRATGFRHVLVFPSQDGKLYAYNPDAKEMAWRATVGEFGDRVSDVHVRGRRVYVGTVDGRVIAMDARTGKTAWVTRGIRGPFQAAPATSADRRWVAVANLYGEVWLLDNRSGKPVARFSTENEIVAAPIFHAGHLLVGSTDYHVYGFDLSRKKLDFLLELSGRVETDPVVSGGRVHFASSDGGVHAVDVEGRRLVWSRRVAEEEVRALIASPRGLLVALGSGSIVVVRPEDGKVASRWKVGDGLLGGLRLAGSTLYVGFESGLLVAWDIEREEPSWKWLADSPIFSPPLLLDERLYVACSSGTLQVLQTYQAKDKS